MSAEELAWKELRESLESRGHDATNLPPADKDALKRLNDSLGRPIPTALRSLYSITQGLTFSGYLPDMEDQGNCTFSLLTVEQIEEWDSILSEGVPSGVFGKFAPHLLRVIFVASDCGCVWNRGWTPFATDGMGNIQFFAKGLLGGVFQYNHESFMVKRCSSSISRYLLDTAAGIRQGSLKA
jgi:cell wall assembly regulator SMI1